MENKNTVKAHVTLKRADQDDDPMTETEYGNFDV